MGVNRLPKTVTQQRRGCDSNPGPSVPESSTLTTRLPSQPSISVIQQLYQIVGVSRDRLLGGEMPRASSCKLLRAEAAAAAVST